MKNKPTKRLSSYKKLKLENKKLRLDIYNIIKKADEKIGKETISLYSQRYDFSDEFWNYDKENLIKKMNDIDSGKPGPYTLRELVNADMRRAMEHGIPDPIKKTTL